MRLTCVDSAQYSPSISTESSNNYLLFTGHNNVLLPFGSVFFPHNQLKLLSKWMYECCLLCDRYFAPYFGNRWYHIHLFARCNTR